jgi:hypothetical protein
MSMGSIDMLNAPTAVIRLMVDDNDPSVAGSSANALIDTDVNFESINAMPHMTAVPVNIVPLKKLTP